MSFSIENIRMNKADSFDFRNLMKINSVLALLDIEKD